jgi:hypothetical protein
VDSDVAPHPDEAPDAPPDAGTDGGAAGRDVLATGAGGCAGCTLARGDGPAAGLAWLLALGLALAGLVLARDRR